MDIEKKIDKLNSKQIKKIVVCQNTSSSLSDDG